jgi:hypothetical protein
MADESKLDNAIRLADQLVEAIRDCAESDRESFASLQLMADELDRRTAAVLKEYRASKAVD